MSPRLKPHPAAEILPMLSEPELAALQQKFVAAREQLVPGVTLDGKILDGRNREEICHRLGWAFKTITWDEWFELNKVSLVPRPSPTEWVLSMNVDRRHLNESQRAIAGAKALPMLEAEAKQRMKAGGGDKRVAPRGATRFCGAIYPAVGGGDAKCTVEVGHVGPHRYDRPVKTGQELRREAKASGKAAAVAAKAVGASTRSVERAKVVLEKRPDLATLIERGKATLGKVEKSIRKEAAFKNVLEYRPPVGTYGVIVADVPWQYDDQLDGSDQARGGVGYPTMSLDEILKVKPPAAADCALWFWTTNAFLIDGTAAQVVKAWGFEAKALYTWRKVDKKGNDRLGSGHYGRNVTEHVILAVRGKPVVMGSDQPNIFDAPRTSRHSEKPDAFFPIAEKVTPCAPQARIELFAIEERKGWVVSGSEQQAKARAQRPDAAARERVVPPEVAAYLERKPEAAAPAIDLGPTQPDDPIQWLPKKHPKIVAVGLGHGGRRYEILREKRHDSKLVGFFWRGGPEGKFTEVGAGWGAVVDTFDQAKTHAEQFESERRAQPPKKQRKLKLREVPEAGA